MKDNTIDSKMSEGLRTIADWFDVFSKREDMIVKNSGKVQSDLRRWATEIEEVQKEVLSKEGKKKLPEAHPRWREIEKLKKESDKETLLDHEYRLKSLEQSIEILEAERKIILKDIDFLMISNILRSGMEDRFKSVKDKLKDDYKTGKMLEQDRRG